MSFLMVVVEAEKQQFNQHLARNPIGAPQRPTPIARVRT